VLVTKRRDGLDTKCPASGIISRPGARLETQIETSNVGTSSSSDLVACYKTYIGKKAGNLALMNRGPFSCIVMCRAGLGLKYWII